jgi:hypothetical protein
VVSVVGEPAAASLTAKVADSAASRLGVKVTLMVHDFPAAKVVGRAPQLFVWEKSPALAPVIVMPGTLSGVNS